MDDWCDRLLTTVDRRLRGILVGLAALVIALALRPGDASALPIVGIADSEADTFAHADFNKMKVTRMRVIVPWDIAQRTDPRRQEFNDWLNAFLQFKASNPDATFSVGFNRANDDPQHPTRVGRAPLEEGYKAAFRDFVAAYGQHKNYMRIGPWNEPNFNPPGSETDPRLPNGSFLYESGGGCDSADPTVNNCGPRLAAYYYRWAREACGDCFLEAGNFAGTESADYLQKYKRHLGGFANDVGVWAVHNYSDFAAFQGPRSDNSPDQLRNMLGEIYCTNTSNTNVDLGTNQCAAYGTTNTGGALWVTATGSLYSAQCAKHPTICNPSSQTHRVFGQDSQCTAAAWMMRWQSIDTRIDRVYHFTYKDGNTAAPHNEDDTGVINGDGSVRKAYKVLRDKATSCTY
jgi:hypothetical protein